MVVEDEKPHAVNKREPIEETTPVVNPSHPHIFLINPQRIPWMNFAPDSFGNLLLSKRHWQQLLRSGESDIWARTPF
jgi:hypothetical protein